MNSGSIMCVGGVDPSGGAGLFMDCRSLLEMGHHPLGVVTTVTVQNGVKFWHSEPVAPHVVRQSMETLFDTCTVRAIKVGALGSEENGRIIETVVRAHCADIPLVVDPVLIATSGGRLSGEGGGDVLTRCLLPLATLVTPNVDEAQALSGQIIEDEAGMVAAAHRIREWGCAYVLVKGGHLLAADDTKREVGDVLVGDGAAPVWFRGPRHEKENVRGTGCALASLCAGNIGRGQTIENAVRDSRRFLERARDGAYGIGYRSGCCQGEGPLILDFGKRYCK